MGRGLRSRLHLGRDTTTAQMAASRGRLGRARGGAAADLLSAEQLDELVALIALYPDELLRS